MRFLIDTRSVQAAVHYGAIGEDTPEAVREDYDKARGQRLRALLGLIEEISGHAPEASQGHEDELRLPYLSRYDCLVLTTRTHLFSQAELKDIQSFVKNGASLLIMSNHPPFDERDNRLARLFGFAFKSPIYPWHGGYHGRTVIGQHDLGDHPITESCGEGIMFNNSCRIVLEGAGNAIILARLPEESPPENIFALAIEGEGGSKAGRIVAIADSGFIADGETKVPGPGLFENVDNPLFLRNVIAWLCHKL